MNPPSVLSSQLSPVANPLRFWEPSWNLANSIVFHFHLWLNPLGSPCSQRTTARKNPLLIETESKHAAGCVGKQKIVISHLRSDYHQHLISMQACAESTLDEIKIKLHRFTLLYSFYHIYPKKISIENPKKSFVVSLWVNVPEFSVCFWSGRSTQGDCEVFEQRRGLRWGPGFRSFSWEYVERSGKGSSGWGSVILSPPFPRRLWGGVAAAWRCVRQQQATSSNSWIYSTG